MGEANRNTKPRILLVIEGTYPWYRGGVSEWVHQYLQNFANYDFTIVQIATDQYLDVSLKEALYSVPNHVRNFIRILPPNLKSKDEAELIRWFGSIKKNIQSAFQYCDLVHIANTGFAGWLGMMMANRLNKPLVLTEHALYWKEVQMGAVALECGYKMPDRNSDRILYIQLLKEIARQIYSTADQIISVSEFNISAQRSLGARGVTYIPNGIDENRLKFSPVNKKEHLTIGWVGRCASMKNPMKFFELIEAFSESGMLETRFIMVSCDANEDRLAQLVKKKSVSYPGLTLVWNESAENYYDRMDALCITSRNESQPLVLFEALARKVLPIGWQTGDVNAKYGLILPQKTPVDQLTNAVIKLWNHSAGWDYEVQKRYDYICNHHTWGTIFKRYKKLFKKLLVARIYANQSEANHTV